MSDEYDDEEEWEEDWEEEEAESDEPEPESSGRSEPDVLRRSIALGWLAMVPMFFIYEFALLATGSTARNTSELVLFRLFTIFGDAQDWLRWIALTGATVWAFAYALKRHFELGPRVLRVVGEGVVGAIIIGPMLIGLIHLFGDRLPPIQLGQAPSAPPKLAHAAFIFGAGAYEELVFRVGAYSVLYVMALRVVRFLGAARGVDLVLADLSGLVGSSVLFSAFHLAVMVEWLGPGGESFDPSIFTYRALAGLLLGILFRWRGVGVAAWTHGLFNLSLLLGAGPDVFL